MSLLELLKEHLKEWPDGLRAISQDADDGMMNGTRHPSPSLPLVDGLIWDHREWDSLPMGGSYFWLLEIADDARTAIVTREMWEAA